MKRKVLFLSVYLGSLPLFLILLVLYSLFYQHSISPTYETGFVLGEKVQYNALPEENASTEIFIGSVEGRVVALSQFFRKYNSPLSSHVEKIVEEADRYGIDYRLLPAIAMQESGLCKKVLKSAPYNCWGFGIYGTKRTGFEGYDQAIEIITKTLAEKYIAYGLTTPELIMTKYAPSSNGSWANGVTFFMTKIDSYL